ncbi:hypothetical protein PM082_016226 [Marasmius tenuissimus]|nr:hypothetical protein PM082_016226 [Marasmius tenuissimus]
MDKFSRSEDVELGYNLPSLVAGVKESWQLSLQCAAVVSTLFAGLSAGLIQTFRSDDDLTKAAASRPALYTYLCMASYGALLLNANVTLTSLVLIDKLGGIWRKSAERGAVFPQTGYLAITGDEDIFKQRMESSSFFRFYLIHWFISLISGNFCIYLQILFYVLLRESAPIVLRVTVVMFVYVLLPIVVLLLERLRRRFRRKTPERSAVNSSSITDSGSAQV